MVLKKVWSLIVILFVVAYSVEGKDEGCNIKFPLSHDDRQPILLQNKSSTYKFAIPNRGELKFKKWETLTLACTEPKNFLIQSNSNLTVVKCVEDTTFSLGSKNFLFEEFNCSKQSKGTIKETEVRCANGGGKLFELGLPIGRKIWLPLIKTCYDDQSGKAFYSEHTMYGQTIANHSKAKFRPSFSSQSAGNVPTSVVYKKEYQKSTFNKILGSAKLAEQYINNKSYLARGHLAPDADFLFASWQFTTYFYVNVVPQWQSINGGNWNAIESTVRRAAHKHNKEFKLFTGSHGVLSLKDVNNNDVDIYLASNDRLPVPKFLWKILYDEKEKNAVVFVSLNNPFNKRADEDDYLCEDVCKKGNWDRAQYNILSKGLVYCCDYSKFKAFVSTAPTLSVRGFLKW